MTDAVGIAMIDGALGAREPDADGRYFARRDCTLRTGAPPRAAVSRLLKNTP